MGERGIEIGRDIDISGLLWIDRFGWIRAKEMGRLLWFNSSYTSISIWRGIGSSARTS